MCWRRLEHTPYKLLDGHDARRPPKTLTIAVFWGHQQKETFERAREAQTAETNQTRDTIRRENLQRPVRCVCDVVARVHRSNDKFAFDCPFDLKCERSPVATARALVAV